MLRVINSRGRVLLEVYDVRTVNYRGGNVPFYSCRGDGCGGYGPAESVASMVATMLADAPSGRVVGELPSC